MNSLLPKVVGVIGAGNFGRTVASLLLANVDVIIYSRTEIPAIELDAIRGGAVHSILNTQSMEELCKECKLIIPVVPSASFRTMMNDFSRYLHPYHIMIHGTKGLDLTDVNLEGLRVQVKSKNIRTISQVIQEETQVVRIGCISGPNLSSEIQKGLPAATVLASNFDEVINIGHAALSTPHFKIYGSHDLIGTELAGALKNIIALGTGIASGMKLGKNIEAFLISRGLREMIKIGEALGANPFTFFGTAGLGDLMATATSPDSRNYMFGFQIGQGKTSEEVQQQTTDLVEGVRTVQLIYHFAQTCQLDVPIVEILYAVIFRKLPIEDGFSYLLDYPYGLDVDYM